MPGFEITSTFDKSQIDQGLLATTSSVSDFATRFNVITAEASSAVKRNWGLIGDESRSLAARLDADQTAIGASFRQNAAVQTELAAAARLVKGPLGESQEAMSLYAATALRGAEAQRIFAESLREVRAAAQAASANTVVTRVASAGAPDEGSRRVAAATLEETAAKSELKDVTDAVAESTLSQAEKETALALVQQRVRAAIAERVSAENELRIAATASADALALEREQIESTAVAQAQAAAAMRASWQQELAAQDRLIEKNGELARARELSTLRADIEARVGQSAAWEQEMLIQDRMIEKNAELTRSREMASLKADILSRSELSSWQQEVIAQDRVIEKNLELARSQELAALKTAILSRAEGELGEASHGVVTGQQAASAAIRSMEGNAGLRAIENFIAKTLNLGPLLQTVFPIVGGLAFGEMILKSTAEIVQLEQKGKHAAEELARGFGEMNEKLVTSNDELALNNSKLEDQYAKLSGHPSNGLQTALLEAKVAADKLQESLASDLKSLNDLLKTHDVGIFEGILSNVGPTGGQSKEIAEYGKDVEKQGREARTAQTRALVEAGQDQAKREAAEKAYYDRMNRIAADAARHMRERATQIAEEQARITAVNTAVTGKPGGGEDLSARRGAFEDAATVYDDLQGRAQLSGASYATQKKIGAQKQDNFNAPDDPKAPKAVDAAKAQLKDVEAQFAELNAATANLKGHPLTANDALNYWGAYLDTFKARSDEAKKVLEEVTKFQDDVHRKIVEGAGKIKAEQARIDEEGGRALPKGEDAAAKMMREQAEDVTRTGARWDAYWADMAKGAEITARMTEQASLTRIQMDEQNGTLSHLAAAQQTARIHADEHTAALKALREELEKLEKEAKRDPVTGAVSDPKQAAKIEGVKNQIGAETGKGNQQKGQDQKAIADAMARPYLAAFNTIENGWMSAQRAMLTGQKSIGQAMRSMWSGIALDAIQNIEKMGFNWARHQLMMVAQNAVAKGKNKEIDLAYELFNRIMHTGTAAAKAATDNSAAATQQATTSAANVASAQSYAAVAAAAAMASTAAIPLVGPELAPGVGAAIYGATSAYTPLAAFEQGTMYVPKTGAAVLHPGEAVLGSPSAQVMRDAMSGKLAGTGGGGGDLHLHMGGNTINGGGDSFPELLSRNESHLVSTLARLHRLGKLSFAR